MTTRDELLKNFVDAARALTGEGLSGLNTEKAVLVDAAMKAGADVCLVYMLATDYVIGALHLPNPASEPVTLFRIEPEEASN